MGNNSSWKLCAVLLVGIFAITFSSKNSKKNDDWHYSDGTPIRCRVSYCDNAPAYSNWDDRFCTEHLDRSVNHRGQVNRSTVKKKVNTTPALSKERAEALKGTGYHGTRPNSFAESSELAAAMVKCRKCGMHSSNGSNSLCDECQYNQDHGLG